MNAQEKSVRKMKLKIKQSKKREKASKRVIKETREEANIHKYKKYKYEEHDEGYNV